jgi:hypothetical protein
MPPRAPVFWEELISYFPFDPYGIRCLRNTFTELLPSKEVAVAQSVKFARGLRATEFFF